MYKTLAFPDGRPSAASDRACDQCRKLKIKVSWLAGLIPGFLFDRKFASVDIPGQLQIADLKFKVVVMSVIVLARDAGATRGEVDGGDRASIIDFRLSSSVTSDANLSKSPTVQQEPYNIADFDLAPEVLHGDAITETTYSPSCSAQGPAFVQPITHTLSASGKQPSDGHSPNSWALMTLPGDGVAEYMGIPLSDSGALSQDLHDPTGYGSLDSEQFSLTCAPPESLHEQSSEQEIWSSIQQFFETMHVIFPVLSYTDLLSRVILQPEWTRIPHLRTLLLAVQMINATGDYRMTMKNDRTLEELTRRVEKSRLSYDFAESPTLDEVMISLFLFTSYNVREKHNRAFLYLDEALSLMESVRTVGGEDECRQTKIEQVLYNTEAASLAIYAGESKSRRARKPRLLFDHTPAGLSRIETGEESEKVALHLLERLTEIHVAEDTEAMHVLNTASETDLNGLFGAAFGMHRYCRIQAADVAVTRQWQLSSKLITSTDRRTGSERLGQSFIENLGTAALAWVCLLKEGEARIVGLGKLAGLAQNMCTLSIGKSTSYSIAGLVSAIIREDHEKRFVPQLADLISPMVLTTPRSLRLSRDAHDKKGYQTSSLFHQRFQVVSSPSMASIQGNTEGADDLSWCINLG
ncbi:hypothetical protein H2200_000796 [Cladophialophora chaetospira]|uniref:Transcription factor domain-containing protein n=1 Tax=Cladophialophora chaetospira TaxID=386627 RepID=A0AA38XP46_9EURO|nr:hypothetical protein H2200_000796 [Cladophialophora chaetospira]